MTPTYCVPIVQRAYPKLVALPKPNLLHHDIIVIIDNDYSLSRKNDGTDWPIGGYAIDITINGSRPANGADVRYQRYYLEL
jgi:hypothetical protein